MPHLLARANQVILEAHWLRREQRALRLEAAIRASELESTILRVHAAIEDRNSACDPETPATDGA